MQSTRGPTRELARSTGTARSRLGGALAALCVAFGCHGPVGVRPLAPGSVEGRIGSDTSGWAVVYLEGGEDPSVAATKTVPLRTGARGLAPELLVLAAGQTVEIHNEDSIHHRFFSSSPLNGFELPTLASGESHRIAFDHPGLVRVYCSLHPGDSGSIFVAPSPHFAKVTAPGSYAIADVPPGRYGLRAWSEGAAFSSVPITVRSGASAVVEIGLGEARP